MATIRSCLGNAFVQHLIKSLQGGRPRFVPAQIKQVKQCYVDKRGFRLRPALKRTN